ncbi:Zn-dependent hydrolase [Peribacillus kribbensis]|uniref:Zn-dependent hydrolase n=1 Tax=Peribacillus kribbensis TaxID=356658 RepID=UPI0004221E11|nr:Zn-dependent hydrolase [Peribacillus kribbensis]
MITEKSPILDKLLNDYNQKWDHSGVSGERLARRLSELAEIGLTDEHGSYRIGFSKEERMAKNLVKKWMAEAGLQVYDDGAGNVFGRLAGRTPALPAVLSGSHVDSVPNGGHFDGPLGVLAALEVAEAWKETDFQPNKPYEVVIFTDEEGARFNGGLSGSSAFTGAMDIGQEVHRVDYEGKSFQQVIEEDGLTLEGIQKAKRDMEKLHAYIEVHIEQGKRLEKENMPVGVVTGIAGPSWLRIQFHGEAGHAGNTPMDDRRDALAAAGEFISEVPFLPKRVSSTAVATVGKLTVHPNGINVIPGRVELFVDIRDISQESLDALTQSVIQKAEEIAGRHSIMLECEQTLNVSPMPVDETLQQVIAAAVRQSGLDPVFLTSGAGHDAMVVGRRIPSAMIFVRSKDGISHNPAEWTTLEDCAAAVHVLKNTLESLTD